MHCKLACLLQICCALPMLLAGWCVMSWLPWIVAEWCLMVTVVYGLVESIVSCRWWVGLLLLCCQIWWKGAWYLHYRFTLFVGCFNRLCITLVAVSHGMSCIVKHVKVWQIWMAFVMQVPWTFGFLCVLLLQHFYMYGYWYVSINGLGWCLWHRIEHEFIHMCLGVCGLIHSYFVGMPHVMDIEARLQTRSPRNLYAMTKMQNKLCLERKLTWKKNDEARRMKDDDMRFRNFRRSVLILVKVDQNVNGWPKSPLVKVLFFYFVL